MAVSEPELNGVGDVPDQVLWQFEKLFEELQNWNAGNLQSKGFGEHFDNPLIIPTKLALVHTEVAEATEAHRCGDQQDKQMPQYKNFDVECADAVIRLMQVASMRGVNLGEVIVAKICYNKTRPHKHGGKLY